MNSPWIVLDRDGVINKDSARYIKSADEWHAIPGSISAIVALKHAGYSIAVATNQSGLARGLFGLDELEAMHEKLQTSLMLEGCTIDAIIYCPHAPEDNCHCRKPNIGLLETLEKEEGINISGSWLVGDSLKDLQLALKKKCKPALVLTGKGKKTRKEIASDNTLKDTPVFENLQGFVNALLEGKLI